MKAILTYHSVDDTGSVISVSPAQLERHLDALAASGARVVPLASLRDEPDDANVLSITFDDGFANFYTTAMPVLAERGIPATVFIVTGAVGGDNKWELRDSRARVPRLPLMSWDEIADAADRGFDIGGHGHAHRSLAGLRRRDVEREVDECSDLIEARLGAPPATFAFPYGDFDANAAAVVAKRFRLAVTTEFRALDSGDADVALPRLDAYYFRGGRIMRRWGSAEFAAYVDLRRSGRALGERMRKRGVPS